MEGRGWKSFAVELTQTLSVHTILIGKALNKGKHETQALPLLITTSGTMLNKGKQVKSKYAEAVMDGASTKHEPEGMEAGGGDGGSGPCISDAAKE